MNKNKGLTTRVFLMFIFSLGITSAFFFIPAGTWNYWQAWVYLGVLFIPMASVMVYLLRNDPELLERRLKSREVKREQKTIVMLSYPVFIAAYLIPGLDRRFGWTHTPAATAIAADIVVLLAYGFFFLVLRENSYASRVIEVEKEQKVISTGPYAVVRHPMYSSLAFLYVFSPLALGSWIGMLPALLLIPVLIIRLLDEEKVLEKDLAGYQEYMQKTRFRLFPGIW